MRKTVYTIIAYDGSEIIDNTLGASRRIKSMDYLESRYRREKKGIRRKKYSHGPLWKLAVLFGMI